MPELNPLLERESLVVEEIENGIVLPNLKIKNGPKWGVGGVIDSNYNYIVQSGLYRKWTSFGGTYKIDPNRVEYIDEDVIWFGFFYKHWGHFLVDFVSRMWFVLNNYNGEYIVYVSSRDNIDGNFLEFFNLLGIPRNRLLRVDSPTKFKKIIIPEYSFSEGEYSNDFLKIYDRIINNALIENSTRRGGGAKYERVYFSRQAFENALNKEYGESIIESIFIENGFKCIYPEKLSIIEQVKVWNEAKWIVSMNGTIPLNLVFCKDKNKKITVLNKTKNIHKNLLDLQCIFSMENIDYIDVYDNRYSSLARNLGDGPFVLTKTKVLIDYCRNNFLVDIKENHPENIKIKFFLIRFYVKKWLIFFARKIYILFFIKR